MTPLQLSPPIEVFHPEFGKGNAVLYTDYGAESEGIFLVILHATGHFMHFRTSEVKATNNYTMGRGNWCDMKDQVIKSNQV